MRGHVDFHGRALVNVSLQASDGADAYVVEAWIDTGFNGDLILPQSHIETLALKPSGTLKATLADGSEVALWRYSCRIDWLGELRGIEVIANDGDFPLVGVGLLLGFDLRISYRTNAVMIN